MTLIVNLVRGGSDMWGSPPANYGHTPYTAVGIPGVMLTLPQAQVEAMGNPQVISAVIDVGINLEALNQTSIS